jgi:hypothetical protein
VELKSVNLITGNTVGDHLIVPGSLLSNNFNISYRLGNLKIIPAKATVAFDQADLVKTYSGKEMQPFASTTPANLPIVYTFNGSATLPVNVGSYKVVAKVIDLNYEGSDSATFIIQPAKATISFNLADLIKTYSGTGLLPKATTNPGSPSISFTFNGSPTIPVDAGTYKVIATVNDINYVGSDSATFIILKAPATVTFNPSDLIKTFTGYGLQLVAITNPAGLNLKYTFKGSNALPVNVGSYKVVATIDELNYSGSDSADFSIKQAQAIVAFNPAELTKTYSGVGMQPSVITNPAKLGVTLTFNSSAVLPVNAASYQVVATVNDLNFTGSNTSTFVIKKAAATVKADDKVIKQCDALPKYTATYSGFINGENSSAVTSLSFSLSPAYKGAAGVYQIIPAAAAANYSFNPVNGTLYVNPFGSGARNIKITLTCITQIAPDANGFTYIANFKYENPNATAVYVPVGTNNLVTSTGKFENKLQPVVFLPGTGTWQARFDGNKITWSVRTWYGTCLTLSSAYATSTSAKCTKSYEVDNTEELVSSVKPGEPIAYPNPTTDKVYITVGNRTVLEKGVLISDFTGKIVSAKISNTEGPLMEIDLTGLKPGVYFIRLNFEQEQKLFRIIKK